MDGSHRHDLLFRAGRVCERYRDRADVGRSLARPLPGRAGKPGGGHPAAAARGSQSVPVDGSVHQHAGVDRRLDRIGPAERLPVYALGRGARVAVVADAAGFGRAVHRLADRGRGHSEDARPRSRRARRPGRGGSSRPAGELSRPDPVGGHDRLEGSDRRPSRARSVPDRGGADHRPARVRRGGGDRRAGAPDDPRHHRDRRQDRARDHDSAHRHHRRRPRSPAA